MTPYLTGIAVKALADETITREWMLAAMFRTKHLPKLEKLLRPEQKKNVGMELKAALTGMGGHKRRHGSKRQ